MEEVHEANLRRRNHMFQDWIDHYHRSNIFAGWLEWNATALQAWNNLLVPWMGSQLFTQTLSRVMENYLAMYKAMVLQERNERIDMVLPPGVGESPSFPPNTA